MKIDLHIHTRTGSDGALTMEEVFARAGQEKIEYISITDHDSIEHQGRAAALAGKHGIRYVTGVELNVTFPCRGKNVSLDFLGYAYDYKNNALCEKLSLIREHREKRARQIVENLNVEFKKEGNPPFTEKDLEKMQEGVDGILSRPHIADYLIKKGLVTDRQQAFDKYLMKCDVPKYPLPPEEASALVRKAGGKFILAHPSDPNGTSLVGLSRDLTQQAEIIGKNMLGFIDGIECWHSRADVITTKHYIEFCQRHRLIMTGGSDCHQKPVIMGTVAVGEMVAGEFSFR